jgi:hypothetical protein
MPVGALQSLVGPQSLLSAMSEQSEPCWNHLSRLPALQAVKKSRIRIDEPCCKEIASGGRLLKQPLGRTGWRGNGGWQIRLAKQSKGLRDVDSALFDWGSAKYTVTIGKNPIGNGPEKFGYSYRMEIDMDGGWLGPNGGSSKTAQ